MVATKLASLVLAVLVMTLSPVAVQGAELRGLISFAGRNVKWGPPTYGTGAEVTYAFLTEARSFAGARNCAEMLPIDALSRPAGIATTAMQSLVRRAAAVWSRAAPITFREIADARQADILIGAQDGRRGVAFTNVSRDERSGPLAPLTRAAICLDPSERWVAAWDGDPDTYDLPRVLVHEIGHAIGLDHLGRDGGIMGYAYIDQPGLELSADDIVAVTRLYGWAHPPARAALEKVKALEKRAAAPPACDTAGDSIECGLTTGGNASGAAARRGD